jgi:glycerol-3-phosphate cytidylyltransferase
MKPKMLFVDDSQDRQNSAIKKYGEEFDVVVVSSFYQAMRQMSQNSFDVVSLDHDMDGKSFDDVDSPTCGMAIVKYIKKTGWPEKFKKPKFIVHSVNIFAASLMVRELNKMGLECVQEKILKRGLVAGAFDIIHPGYISLFKDAKSVCSYLIVALNVDPSREHPDKRKPIFSVEERTGILLSLRFVDEVIPYTSEAELTEIIIQKKPDIRILGKDHKGQTSRAGLEVETFYRNRQEDEWSMSRIREAFKNE